MMLSIIWVSTAFLVLISFTTFITLHYFYNYKKKWLKLQWFPSIRGNVDYHVDDCAVCLGEVCKAEKLRALPICGHSFHVHCIDAWLKVRPTCPLCRVNVAPHRNFLLSSLFSFAKTARKWVQNPLCLELTSAVCESFGYI